MNLKKVKKSKLLLENSLQNVFFNSFLYFEFVFIYYNLNKGLYGNLTKRLKTFTHLHFFKRNIYGENCIFVGNNLGTSASR